MIVGYARTSTEGQSAGFEAQIKTLQAQGCERIFSEQVSAVAHRAQLDIALQFIRDGDVLMVTRLDRLARSMRDLMRTVETIEKRGAALRILDLMLDTSSATGRMMLQMLGAVAEFERRILLERQLEGIAKAKREGKYKGRKPTARAKSDEMKAMMADGVGPAEVARRLGVSRASVYRIVRNGAAAP